MGVAVKAVGSVNFYALVYGIDYTVSGAPSSSSVSVTLTTPAAAGAVYRLTGARIPSRTTSLAPYGASFRSALETELDNITIVQQELRRDFDRLEDYANASTALSGPFVYLKEYGVKADGVTDDTAAIQLAVNSLPAYGGELIFPPGICIVSATIQIGDGTNSIISSKTGIVLRGIGGVSDGLFGPPRYGVVLKWAGALGGTVVKVNGPIHSCRVDGGMFIDCANIANIGLDLAHPYACFFDGIMVGGYRTKGIYLRTISAALFSGITQGAMDNVFRMCSAVSPALNTARGLHIAGYEPNNIGCSRNTFIGGRFAIGGASAADSGIYIEYADNNTFIEVFTYYGTASTSGKGVYFHAASNPLFPVENMFMNCPIVGGVGGTPGTGGNIFWPYPTSDGEPTPVGALPFLTHTGLLGNLYKIYLDDGTAASPSYLFNADQDTGIYRPGANTIGVALGGVGEVFMSPGKMQLQSANPNFEFYSTGAAANAKIWRMEATTAGTLQLETWTDAGLFGQNVVVVTRSGTTATVIDVAATTLTLSLTNIGFFGAAAVAQQGTTGTAAGFTAGAGTAVTDDSTFTGNVGSKAYRISDIVRALKNLGLLASS